MSASNAVRLSSASLTKGRVIMAWEEAVQAAHSFDNRHNNGELDENHLVARQEFLNQMAQVYVNAALCVAR